MKKVYVSENEDSRRRVRSVVRWKDRVKKYMHQRVADRGGGIEQVWRVWIGRGSSVMAIVWRTFPERMRHQILQIEFSFTITR